MFYSNSWTKCLICLIFITGGNAECPKPEVEGHVVLTNDALLKNDFPDGTEATFECANGYSKVQGSESITCTNGEWSTLELTCKKKDCGAPIEIPHLTYEFGEEGTLFGASARAICDKGYQLMGPSYRQCYAVGWSRRPKCEVVTCEKPTEIMNGTITKKPDKEFPEYGGVIQYSCDEGYTLIGNKSIECNEDGEYNSFPPECKDVNDIPLKPTTTISTTILTVPPTIRDVNDIPLKPTTTISTTISTVPPTIRDVNDIPLKPTTTISTTILTVPPTIRDVNDIPLKPTTTISTTISTVPPTIRDVNDIPLKPTTTISTTTTTSTVPPTKRDVNDIPFKPTTTISTTTTLTVPPTIRGRNNGVGENDTNTATGNATIVGSLISTVIVTLIVLFTLYRCNKRKGARTAPIC